MWIITQRERDIPEAWRKRQYGPWWLGYHRIPVWDFAYDQGRARGWFLGWPIFATHSDDAFDISHAVSNVADLQATIDTLSGRFVAAVFSPQTDRLYLDAAGLLAAVYSPIRRIVASHPELIGGDPSTELIKYFNVRESNAFFCFGLTPIEAVHRLLPNHYLDLNTFEPVRHWLPEPNGLTNRENIGRITKRVQSCIEALCSKGEPYMTLTGGRDSRMLLAIAKDLREGIQFLTYDLPDKAGHTDVRVATKIAKKLGLKHHVMKFVPPKAEHVDEWHERSGNMVGCRGKTLATVKRGMNASKPMIFGAAAEVGRAFFWREQDLTGERTDLLRRMAWLPRSYPEELIVAAAHWRAPLTDLHPCALLDLLYIEQRLGCWLGPSIYPENFSMYIAPFANRQIFEAMMSLPYEYRFQQRMAEDIIEASWSELLQWEFNPPSLRERVRRRMHKTPLLWRFA